MKNKIILASASPRRQELLKQIGLDVEVKAAKGEEITDKEQPQEMVKELSVIKAMEVAADIEDDTVVIAADTMVSYWGAVMGKPKTKEEASAMLQTLQGNTHQVFTGVTLVWKAGGALASTTFCACTDVTLFAMTPEEVEAYVESGEPMDKAGGYGIQGHFAAFVQGICGDYNNVVGLPTGRLYQELKKQQLI